MTETTKQRTHEGSRPPSFDVVEIIRLLLQNKKFVMVTTAVITIAAIVISLLLPQSFKSTAVILPEADKSKLGGLSDLVSIVGVSPGDASPVKLYPAIMKSETVMKTILYKKYMTKSLSDSINLIDYWGIHAETPEIAYETALALLRTTLDVSVDTKTNIITLTIETGEAQLSADIINGVTSELDKYMRTKRTTNATKQRKWIEARLSEIKQDLASAENRVKEFREKNRAVAGSPLLLLDQDRLLREVQINGTIYTELKKQFELIKIEEIKNTPIVNVMDAAVPAARKDKPRRTSIVLTTFLLAIVGSVGFVFIKNNYSPQIYGFFSRIRA